MGLLYPAYARCNKYENYATRVRKTKTKKRLLIMETPKIDVLAYFEAHSTDSSDLTI